ncbi:MAG: porin family protein [Planctomycetaceae bacterium]|nr:porin family protein [Planctomycetaceae bacterium]
MKAFVLTLATLASLAATASAQESFRPDPAFLSDEIWTYEKEDQVEDFYLSIDRESAELPRSLAEPLKDEAKAGPFSLGASGGYLRARHADRGTWFGGVQARLRLGIFAAEASVQFHQNRYENNDVIVTQYPVQLTAFLYFLSTGPIRPYILGGVGWYYTQIDYRGAFASVPDDRQHIFGEHLGAGAELFLSPHVSLDGDVRYIFLNPSTDQVIGRDFNYWQITAGINFLF